ncbi:LytR/AlgR family response regulator transcription factor [Puia dinghuensis]|uniref:DNA-binding response regulator n=1 Tax=Puia dinghuensis TaxID=1792502 RepID=A0A8J2U7V1_9BACT|nr:LytTR family DNA-binding domain-containing protein [Puia dinghuensis]GGA84628.1 DNA-binding response regulator [Puia dinghuensis]
MNKIRCVIADDEALSREVLESYIAQLDKLQLITQCKNGLEVFSILKQQPVDLLFLDVQMPQLTGIELLRSLQHPPKVVLTTAYRDFAMEGFELNVLDYLLKPISFERFLKAIDKYESNGMSAANVPQVHSFTGHAEAFIYVKADKKMVKVFLKNIFFIESRKDYVRIRTADKDIITYQTMNHFEETLPDVHFLRVHRSYIVALEKITAVTAAKIEMDDLEIPIGAIYQKQVWQKLFNFNPNPPSI